MKIKFPKISKIDRNFRPRPTDYLVLAIGLFSAIWLLSPTEVKTNRILDEIRRSAESAQLKKEPSTQAPTPTILDIIKHPVVQPDEKFILTTVDGKLVLFQTKNKKLIELIDTKVVSPGTKILIETEPADNNAVKLKFLARENKATPRKLIKIEFP